MLTDLVAAVAGASLEKALGSVSGREEAGLSATGESGSSLVLTRTGDTPPAGHTPL